MSKINAEWHKANRMPKNPTKAERITWHRAHAAHCGCREMPESIRKLIEEGINTARGKQQRGSSRR